MASVRITQRWPDGDELTVCVRVDESYPDVVAEAKAQAAALWREALGLAMKEPD